MKKEKGMRGKSAESLIMIKRRVLVEGIECSEAENMEKMGFKSK